MLLGLVTIWVDVRTMEVPNQLLGEMESHMEQICDPVQLQVNGMGVPTRYRLISAAIPLMAAILPTLVPPM